jgi:hypothetical protein
VLETTFSPPGLRPVPVRPDRYTTWVICLACGEPLPAALANAGSLRCHDCRLTSAPVLPLFVRLEQLRRRRVQRGEASLERAA